MSAPTSSIDFAKEFLDRGINLPFPRGGLKSFLDLVSEEKGVSVPTARSLYYKFLKSADHSSEARFSLAEGEPIEIEATAVSSYGAFAFVLGSAEEGFLHVTDVSGEPISDLRCRVKEGDKIAARIKSSDGGRLSFEADGEQLPDYGEIPPASGSPLAEAKEKPPVAEPVGEREEIAAFLSRYAGVLSPQAEKKFQSLLEGAGVFKFSFALARSLPHFERDLGLLLLREVENEMKSCFE